MLTKRQAGLSLIELMIGLLVGAIIVAGAVKIFTGSAKNSTDNINLSMLNQDLRIMMDVMVRDLRRAGYMSTAAITDETVFLNAVRQNPFADINIENSGACITYMYDKDLTTPGGVDNADRLGFKLDNTVLKMRRTATAIACSTTNASTKWESITSPEVDITELSFSRDDDYINITKKMLNPAAAVVTNDDIIGDEYMIIRNITITLNGALKEDAGVTQTLTETVRVRNDRYCRLGGVSPRTCI